MGLDIYFKKEKVLQRGEDHKGRESRLVQETDIAYFRKDWFLYDSFHMENCQSIYVHKEDMEEFLDKKVGVKDEDGNDPYIDLREELEEWDDTATYSFYAWY